MYFKKLVHEILFWKFCSKNPSPKIIFLKFGKVYFGRLINSLVTKNLFKIDFLISIY